MTSRPSTARTSRIVARAFVALIVVVTAVIAAQPALATEGSGWRLTTTTSPTNLKPDSPRNESQTVSVQATGGTFTLTFDNSCANAETTSPIPYNATAGELQATIETLSCTVGAGNVLVSGGPGAASPYIITFVAERGDRPLPRISADSSLLTGSASSVTIGEQSEGAFAPEMTVSATNVGSTSSDGSVVTIAEELSPGIVVTAISAEDLYKRGATPSCSLAGIPTCTFSEVVDPGDVLMVKMTLAVPAKPPVTNSSSTVSGGGLEAASDEHQLAIGAEPVPFGPTKESVITSISTNQAGAHPDVTAAFTMNTSEVGEVPADLKDIRFDMPSGLVGNTVGVPQCVMSKILEETKNAEACPRDAMVGMATITIGVRGIKVTFAVPVYAIAPAPGEPVAFAFDAVLFPVRLDTSVLSDGNYNVRITAPDLPQAAATLVSNITIWGVPADHNGPGADTASTGLSFGEPNPGQTRVPLLTSPQQCSEPLTAVMSADSWTKPGVFAAEEVSVGRLTACETLSFGSSFSMLPDTLEAGAPAGYSFDLNIPQSNDPDGLATPNVKGVTLALPIGTVVNPSAAWGLKACSDAQFGLHSGVPAACPREAQVGTVRIKTPALEEALEGQVYLGEPSCSPCTPQDAADGRMVRLFVNVVGEGESGIVVKLEGHGRIDQSTGQIITNFEENPQLPFSTFELTLGGGSRAVLANPRVCGQATSNLDLTPWSSPFTGDSTPAYTFDVSQGCFGPQFAPSFVAGSTNIQSGEYSPFTVSFGRSDHDEFLNGLQIRMPAGLLGMLSSVTPCGEPEASQGACAPQSLIGHVQVLTGPGADPFLVSGGQVFITGPYKGAPYGLSIVVPAVAGPYTLSGTTGHGTVVVRAAINVDPNTAALTVTSDPLPTSLDGIPLQLKVVNVTIDRPGFTFNPTSCVKTAITSTLLSAEGLSASASTPFQVTNCADLGFKPSFKVSTSAKVSRSAGASLDAKVIYPTGAKLANIAKVKVDLPKQLPSRLTTLQQACPDRTFKENPAACNPGSMVGVARVNTPVLTKQLTGPVYFVSHGGAAFPDLVVVLQGEGVRVDLVGSTFISKKGITSSTFDSVPDVPITSFELYLPEGPHSALAATGNLCKSSLKMPTSFVAQNGLVIHQATPIAVTGCAKKQAKKVGKVAVSKAIASRGHGKQAGNGRGN